MIKQGDFLLHLPKVTGRSGVCHTRFITSGSEGVVNAGRVCKRIRASKRGVTLVEFLIMGMNILFYRIAKLFKFVPIRFFSKLTNQKIIFPFYHIISNEDVIHIKHLYKIRNVKMFEKDLDFLLKNYNPIDINSLYEIIINKYEFKKPSFLLSFDDGLREFHDIVAPILLKKGVPSINFLNSGFIDNKDLFFRYKLSIILEKLKSTNLTLVKRKNIELWFKQNGLKFDEHYNTLYSIHYGNKNLLDDLAEYLEIDFKEYLMKYKPYMTSEQIKSLILKGFSFGAHSVDHPLYSQLNLEQQLNQTSLSINNIVSEFNLKYRLFSFPFTDISVSNSFFNAIFNDGQPIAEFTFGSSGIKKDIVERNFQRIPLEIDLFTAEDIVYGEYLYYLFKVFFNKNIIIRLK